MKEKEFNLQWVTCTQEGSHCGQSPCMAIISNKININKFDECFYSHNKVRWRKAYPLEMPLKCVKCKGIKIPIRGIPR